MTNTGSTPTGTTRTSPRLRVVQRTSRLVAGLAVAAGLVVAVVVAVPAPLPQVRGVAAQSIVTPDAGESVLVCPGPFLVLGRDAGDALRMQSTGSARVTVSSDGAEPVLSDLVAVDVDGDSAVPIVTAPADLQPAPYVAAAQSVVFRDSNLSGLAAGACRPASMQAWLVGGTAAVGASDVITLANHGEVPSTVTLTTYGESAPVVRTTIVGAGTQVAVPLASAVVGEQAPVVHVSADGAPVRATLQSSLVRTLDPGGVDLQDDAGAPALAHTIAGVRVVAPRGGDVTTQVRLMATEVDTDVSVTVRSAGSTSDRGTPLTVRLAAGVPVDLGLPGLTAGVYSVDVAASAPVVTAVSQATGFHAGSDFAWMTPAPVLEGVTALAVPERGAGQLHIMDAAGTDQQVVLTEMDSGAERVVDIPAEGSALVAVRSGAAYTVSSDAAIRAAVTLSGTDALAGWPLWPESSRPVPITVYP